MRQALFGSQAFAGSPVVEVWLFEIPRLLGPTMCISRDPITLRLNMQMLRVDKFSSSTCTRPFVGVVADGCFRDGRDIVLGAMRYANTRRQWEVYGLLRRFSDWPTCDGAIVGNSFAEEFEIIRRKSRYVISCSGSTDPDLMPVVCLDDFETGRVAAQHLLECGLKIFSFYGVPGKRSSDNRAIGFATSVRDSGYSCIHCPFVFPGWSDPVAERPWIELGIWLKSLPKPVGIMAVDDSAAHYLASACRYEKINVPEHVAIIGVNNDEAFCESACTPLSSVEAGFTRVGFAASRLLDRLLLGDELRDEERIIRLPPLGVACRDQ